MYLVKKTPLKDLLIISPVKIQDTRGYFCEIWNQKEFSKIGINEKFVQDHSSFSKKKGTLRGLHYQTPPYTQSKLVSCNSGGILDIVVDVRNSSPTYGKWHSEKITFKNFKQIYVPSGFLHGFVTLEPNTEVLYKCSNYYNKKSEKIVLYNDPLLNINWEINKKNIYVAKKDKQGQLFKKFKSNFKVKK